MGSELGELIERIRALSGRVGSASESRQAQAWGARPISEAMLAREDGTSQTASGVAELRVASSSLEQGVSSLRERIARFQVA